MSDITSFIGTIFLFMYWPSFNGALALSGSPRQTRAFINTVLSISGSCVAAFIVSVLFRTKEGKLFMVDIQNATLAGGVAMGTCADMRIYPAIAIAIGLISGTVSTFGFIF